MQQPIIGKIEQLTQQPCQSTNSPTNKIVVPIELDTTALDEAQKKADKLKETLSEVQEFIRKTNLDSKIANAKKEIFAEITAAINAATTCQIQRNVRVDIEKYSMSTTPNKNTLNVDFVFLGKAMEPKEYQLFLDQLQNFCEEITKASQRRNA